MITSHQSSLVAATRIHLLDPREVVFILDHSTEKSLFLRALQERIPGSERRNFVLDIIDRVRNFTENNNNDSDNFLVGSLPENLHRNFVTVALPEILQNLPPANMMRQGIANFGAITIRASDSQLVNQNCNDNTVTRNQCCNCSASRISITGKAGATNSELLKFLGLTHFVKCCELVPQHQGKTAIIITSPNHQSVDKNQKNSVSTASASMSSIPIVFDAGIKDDDSSPEGIATLSSKFDSVVDFVKKVLRDNKSNRVLIYCQAGRHRSAWYSAAVLAALSRDPEFCCPCLADRTRYYSSLGFSACQIVKQARNFVDYSPSAEEQISNWIESRGLKAYQEKDEENSQEEKGDE